MKISLPSRSVAAAITAAYLLLTSAPANAQPNLGPFELQPRNLNPLREPFFFSAYPSPAAVDLDNDGDLDIVIGTGYDGSWSGRRLRYLKNEGSAASPLFREVIRAEEHPFMSLFADDYPALSPSFGDLDKDGDPDMIVGVETGTILYFKNTGTKQQPKFELQSGPWNAATKEGNPFDKVYVGYNTSPHMVDFDKDGDMDVLFGSNIDYPYYQNVHYFANNGDGNFTYTALSGISMEASGAAPVTVDFDKDGDLDIFTGDANGYFAYFKNTAGSFEAQDNPLAKLISGYHLKPLFIDLDNDKDSDLIIGSTNGNLDYLENKGNDNYEKKNGLNDPFGGVTVNSDASPLFTDIDGDTDVDVVIGGSFYAESNLKYYKNEKGNYTEQIGEASPFSTLQITNGFTPSWIDLNGDGAKDLVGAANDYIQESGYPFEYFKNQNGILVPQPFFTSPFKDIDIHGGKSDFVDIDADGDYDLFISDYQYENESGKEIIRYYENTGSAKDPVFTEQMGTDNPLSIVVEEYTLYLRFADIDHDGDYDALIGEGGGVVENETGNEFSYYENTGTSNKPAFIYSGDIITPGLNPLDPSPAFIDQDNDGDLDLFIGDGGGNLSYYKNNNEPPVTTLKATTVTYIPGTAAVTVDPELTLADSDRDSIVYAWIAIGNFIAGSEILTFTAQPGITGTFDTTTGRLTFKGKAPVTAYQSLLRTVAFQFTGADTGGRKKNAGRAKDITQTITFSVFDVDFTTPVSTALSVAVIFNAPPVITPEPLSMKTSSTLELNLLAITSDPDNNLDPKTFQIIEPPLSGAEAIIQQISATEVKLILDYSGISFKGTDQLKIRACDALNACAENTISVEVQVTSEVHVHNAVAPHSPGNNRYMRILNLPAGNKVSIYNRWGDEVFQVENYDNDTPGKRFEGLNNNGKELATGTYFYKIEFNDGSKTITGYLALKQ